MKMKIGIFLIFAAVCGFAAFLFLGGAFFSLVEPVEAAEEMKTLSFFVGQQTSAASSVSWPFTFYVGDDISTSTKSAFFEISGISPSTANLIATTTLSGGSGSCSLNRTLDNNGRLNKFKIVYDATNCIDVSAKGEYSRTLNVVFNNPVDALSAKFAITYRFTAPTSNGSTAIKTISYSANEGTASSSVPAGQNIVLNFSPYIGDEISTSTKSAFFEISGVSLAAGASAIDLSLGGGSGSCSVNRTLDTTGFINKFHILYNVNDCINIFSKGEYSRSLTINASGAAVYVYSAKLVLTYQFTPPSAGGYWATGTFYSPIFDTGAINGASYNWIMWKGTLNGGNGKIRLQLATSNSSGGPWTYIGETPGCDSSVYFEPLTDISKEIKCFSSHNNKRYFRYKLIICSSSDCSAAGTNTPQVNDVIVNWSP